MEIEKRDQVMKDAIESLFTTSGSVASQAEMSEIQMAFGILLQSCGLLELTKDEIGKKIEETKHKLDKASLVRIKHNSSLHAGYST